MDKYFNISNVFAKCKEKKKTFFFGWLVTIIVSIIWVLPQPRYYVSQMSLAPETGEAKEGGGLSSIASNFGINIGGIASTDAIYPQLYPELFKSTNFMVGLMSIKLTSEDGKSTMDYYTYLTKHQKKNSFLAFFSLIGKSIKGFFSADDSNKKNDKMIGADLNPFKLSKKDMSLIEDVQNKIQCIYNKKNDVISISVRDQDPYISALLVDSVTAHLQTFIVEYRTKKAKVDYEYYKKITAESKRAYEIARQKYASFADANQEVTLQSVKAVEDDLENEMQLKYNMYSAMTTRLETAMAKVQENTPAFTVLNNSTVPTKPAGPKRSRFVLGMLIFITFIMIIWYSKDEFKLLIRNSENNEE